MSRTRSIGRAELDVLKYIQDHHPVTVGQVAAHLLAVKGQKRTTALNVMTRLVQKGYLARKRVEGVYQYSPRVGKGELLRRLVGDFVDKALGGSLSPFVAYLARDAEVKGEELRELKRIVEELEAKQREGKP